MENLDPTRILSKEKNSLELVKGKFSRECSLNFKPSIKIECLNFINFGTVTFPAIDF